MGQISNKFIRDDAVDESKFKLSNDAALRARNAANSADVDLFKLDASDVVQFLQHPRISSSASNADDVLTKKDQDAALEGLKPKEAVRLATTANIALTGIQTLDGVLGVAGDRILVKDQTDASENGIYVMAAGAWARAADFDSLTPIDEIHNASMAVQEGSTQTGYVYVQYGTVTTIDTSDITFTVRANQTILGGDGIDVTGTTVSVDHDGEGLQITSSQLALELDGSTLSKSASGLKVADNGIDEAQLSSNIDADSFQLSAGYAASAGTPAIGDTVEVAIEKIQGTLDAISTSSFSQETFVLTGTDISNQYVDLAQTVSAGSVHMIPEGGPAQVEGVDFTLSDGGGFTRITFAGDLASGGDAALVNGDTLYIKYAY